MRRLTVLGFLLALVAGLLPLAQIGVAHAQSLSIQISPAIEGNTAVRAGQQVNVSGNAPAGAITRARLVAVTSGDEAYQDVRFAVGRPAGDGDYLRNDDGQLSGRLTLGCIFGPLNPTCPDQRDVAQKVLLELTIAGVDGRSNPLNVDVLPPHIVRYELRQTNRIRVVFNEPVRHPEDDNPLDWCLRGDEERCNLPPDALPGGPASLRIVTAVEGPTPNDCVGVEGVDPTNGPTGCTRTLVFTPAAGEDDNPHARYELSRIRQPYQDYASNNATRTLGNAFSDALDRIRPAIPNIESIDGKVPSGGEVYSRNPSPDVRLTNVTSGHRALLVIRGTDGTKTQTEPTKVEEGANSVDVRVPALPADGRFTFSAVAIDPSGNRSDELDKSAARADGPRPTATYVLDTVAPKLLLARLVNSRTVEVVFTEPIFPPGNAGEWRVGDQRVTAEGSGDQRRLVSQSDLATPVGDVRWTPTSDDPGSTGRYGDRAGNGMAAITGVPLTDLPPIGLPTVTVPAGEVYTNASRQRIAGTAPKAQNLVVELYERGAQQPRRSATVSNGTWSFDEPLDADRRYEFEVRLRHTGTGQTSPRVAVPDIVRDTAEPIVDVVFPDQKPLGLDNPTQRERQYGVGSSVPIRWRATDEAPNDPKRPEHGDFATITMVARDGARRVIADNIPHQPREEQTYSYTLTQADLAGQGSRYLRFEVTVTDLARNRGSDQSAEILLLANLIGYQPALVQLNRIDVRFPVAIEGETTAAEWYVDNTPVQQAQKTSQEGGATVVRLTVAQNNDPNWVPTVEYRPLAVNPTRLRSSNGAPVSTEGHVTVDELAPALSVQTPNVGNRPIDADSVTFSGTTDRTRNPNTVFAFRTSADGAPQGAPVASTTAGTDGEWRMDVPLAQNAVNRLVVRASDPSGNVSARLPNPPFTVVEDSLAPIVQITSPKSGALVPPVVNMTWETIEANKETVRIEYRVGDGEWRVIADRIDDTGNYRWEIPEQDRQEVISLRVTATDQVGKTGSTAVEGLRLDVNGPTILKARASGAQVLDITFSEPVNVDGDGFTIGGAAVRRVDGDGERRTFILDRPMDSTTPLVEYSGAHVVDEAGNELEAASFRAKRSFAFAVTELEGRRVATNRVRVSWSDTRNRHDDLRGYRVYRDGSAIALVGAATRSFTDDEGSGRHIYSVRAVDDRRRVSSVRRVTVQ